MLIATICAWRDASAWGNVESHPRLTDGGIARSAGLERQLRAVLGLRAGSETRLALQLNLTGVVLAGEVEPDIDGSRMPSGDSRFERSGNKAGVIFPVYTRPAGDVWAAPVPSCPSGADFDVCFENLERYEVARLLRAGSFGEDNPNRRASHHFHDPVRVHNNPAFKLPGNRDVPGDNRGLDNTQSAWGEILGFTRIAEALTRCCRGGGDFRLAGLSARDRALNLPEALPAQTADPVNLFDLPRAEEYLFNAFSQEERDVREHFFALHFLAVGSVLHLLQDMTSVAHTRNDFLFDHVADGSALEALGERADIVELTVGLGDLASTPDLLISRPYLALAQTGDEAGYSNRLPSFDASGTEFTDFWDSPSRSGLAEIVNAQFFSAATVDDRGGNPPPIAAYPLPPVPSCDPPGEKTFAGERVVVRDLHWRDRDNGKVLDQFNTPFLSSALVPHLARCRMHAIDSDGDFNASREGAWVATVSSDSVQRDYIDLLHPLAIDYTAKFLERYYAPRIEVVPTGPRAFALRNPSDRIVRIRASALHVAYDDDEQKRWSLDLDCGSAASVIEIAPNAIASTTCTLPTSLPAGNAEPAASADFWVVARGAHGERGTSDPNDFETAGFVTFVAHIQPEILFQSAGPLAPGETDEESQSDLIAIPADLTRSVTSAKESPTLRNLGLELRPALAQRFNLSAAQLDRLDFISPSAEPGGARVALAMDLEQARGTVIESPNDIWILDLTKSPEAEAALTIVPKTKPRLGTLGPRWVAWNRDGVNDNVVFGAADPVTVTTDLERHDVATGTSLSPRETNHFPGSLHGGVLAAVPTAVNASDISDIHLVDLGTGIGTHRFELGTLDVEPCGPMGCSVGSSTAPAQEEEPEFSPDGTQVAFISAPTGEAGYTGGALYVADLIRSGDAISGGSLRRIGSMDRAMSPIWSPDGAWIVYQDNVVHDLFAVPAVGGDSIRLTYTGTLTAGNLTWLSPLALPTNP